MKFKIYYLIAPLIIFSISAVGGLITSKNMDWYDSINVPSFTPPGSFIGLVWTVIFFLFSISMVIILSSTSGKKLYLILGLAVLNMILNVLWSYLFFGIHKIGWAVVEAAILEVSVLSLIFSMWGVSKLASILLFPYAGWVAFATYLTYQVYILNL